MDIHKKTLHVQYSSKMKRKKSSAKSFHAFPVWGHVSPSGVGGLWRMSKPFRVVSTAYPARRVTCYYRKERKSKTPVRTRFVPVLKGKAIACCSSQTENTEKRRVPQKERLSSCGTRIWHDKNCFFLKTFRDAETSPLPTFRHRDGKHHPTPESTSRIAAPKAIYPTRRKTPLFRAGI